MAIDSKRFKESSSYPDEPYVAEHFFAYLGRLFAHLFVRTPLTPNQITWFWGGLMVLSGLLYSTGSYVPCILGGIIWVCAYGMDYTDGIIARYKDMKSAKGAYLDLVVHRVTYPILMFCIGWGVYVSGGVPWIDFFWFDDTFYIYLGLAAGVSMDVFMDLVPMYEKFKVGEKTFEDRKGSTAVEGRLVKNQDIFKKLMNFNPLVFTNMMLMLPVFAILDLMGLFIIIYGVGYTLVTAARVVIMYRDL